MCVAHKYTVSNHREMQMEDHQAKLLITNMKRFLSLCCAELGLTSLPPINWMTQKGGVENRTFGQYVPDKKSIDISIRGRHPLDIMRTLAHELVHYKQSVEGRLKPQSGKTGSQEENEANSKAGIIMRKFAKAYPDAFSQEPINEDNRRVRTIDPKSLDAIYNIQSYNRDLKTLQKNTEKEREQERRAKKKSDDEQRRETDPEFKKYIRVYMLPIAIKAIRYWRSSKDKDWIQRISRNWTIAKKKWPKEVLDDIYSDPKWKENVVRAFEIADDLLRLKEMPAPNRPGLATGRLALDRLGVDPQDAIDVYNNLTDVIKMVLNKYNIDKHGLRLPPKR